MPPSLSGRLFSVLSVVGLLVLTGCASSGPPQLPYPAFIQVGELEDTFMASLPGIRAKQLAGDPQQRTTSNLVTLPPAWEGTTGGAPGKALEIFVVQGSLSIADVTLGRGGYAYVPPGTLGFNLKTRDGARILYFLDNVDPLNMIKSPIIIDSGLLEWQATDVSGVTTKALRSDPGSGANTWLERVEPGTTLPWQASSALREGYMLAGTYTHSECMNGEPQTWPYRPGGYFYRPGGVINGGPEAAATSETVWLLREKVAAKIETFPNCE